MSLCCHSGLSGIFLRKDSRDTAVTDDGVLEGINTGSKADRDHAELVMLYKVTIDDVERAKQWGWKVTYTTIAAQGAILGLFSTYKADAYIVSAKIIFILLAFILALLGIKYIRHSQASLQGFRDRIKAVRGQLGEICKSSFGEETEKKIWPLERVVWGATLLVIILIILRPGA